MSLYSRVVEFLNPTPASPETVNEALHSVDKHVSEHGEKTYSKSGRFGNTRYYEVRLGMNLGDLDVIVQENANSSSIEGSLKEKSVSILKGKMTLCQLNYGLDRLAAIVPRTVSGSLTQKQADSIFAALSYARNR